MMTLPRKVIMLKKLIAFAAVAFAIIVVSAPTKVEAQVLYGSYCCDGNGVRRCVLVNPLPVNSGCFCVGQGNGITCL